MHLAPTVLDYVTLGIALWGAVLSTILAIRNIQKDKRQIRVNCSLIEQTISQDGIPHNQVVGIKAVNTGHRDVRLEDAGLITKARNYYVSNTQKLPTTLHDGDAVTIGIKLDDAEARLREFSPSAYYIIVYVTDTEGNFYTTSRFPAVMVARKMARQSWSLIKLKCL